MFPTTTTTATTADKLQFPKIELAHDALLYCGSMLNITKRKLVFHRLFVS
jgi:hypothetical protein